MITRSRLRLPISGNDHVQGPSDGRLVLLEYGDYQCPFCGRAYPIVKKLQETLKDDLRIVFRNFPMSIPHPYALPAARAAEAAAMQGKFWEMHDLLYENQDRLMPEFLFTYAERLALDPEKFGADIESEAVDEKISKDIEGGARGGVNGTPTFFINGIRHDGDWSYRSLLDVLTQLRMAG